MQLWFTESYRLAGELLPAFRACLPVFRQDIATCRFLLPYVVRSCICEGNDAARVGVRAEMEAVLAGAAGGHERELCGQAVFALLDDLRHAWENAKSRALKLANGVYFKSSTQEYGMHVHDASSCCVPSGWHAKLTRGPCSS